MAVKVIEVIKVIGYRAVTTPERAYVRDHLDEVNERLRQQGMREIDPTDPEMAERYGLMSV